MFVESLLASLMLMGGCTTSAVSFDDIDSYHDAIAETAVSSIDDNYLSDVPDAEETMLLSESSSSDSNSLQCTLSTYNYYGTRMAGPDTGASGMYYNSEATPDVNYFSVMSLNVSSIISQYSGSQYTLYLNVPGSLSSTSTAYYVYDNNGQQTLGSFYAADNTITLEIEMGSSSTDPVITNGYMNLSFFHFTQFPTHENLYSSVTYSVTIGNEIAVPNQHFSSQTINVYIPEAERDEAIPVILTLHGGTWQDSNNTSEYYITHTDYRNSFANYEDVKYAHIDIKYRLIRDLRSDCTYTSNGNDNGGQPTCQDMLYDINNAIEYIINNYASVLDVNNMTLWGYSAGAHLARWYNHRFPEKGYVLPFSGNYIIQG